MRVTCGETTFIAMYTFNKRERTLVFMESTLIIPLFQEVSQLLTAVSSISESVCAVNYL